MLVFHRWRTARSAFTLIELLAVVAIIGILISLLLPAVQAARETARRTQCVSHLARHILAVQNYESFHQCYPPGTVDTKGPILNRPLGYHHNWVSQLLPFLEQGAVYHQIDRQVGVYHKNNAPVRKLGFNFFNCPSSSWRQQGYTNYAGVHHPVRAPIDVDNQGIFFLNSRIRRGDVTDGLSNTLFIGEKLGEPGDLGWMSGTVATLRNTGERLNGALHAYGGRLPSLPSLPPGVDPLGGEPLEGYWEDPETEALSLGGDPATGNRRAADFVGGFASYHPGGVNFAFGDGSVRQLAEAISQKVLSQLGHRSDGQLLDPDW